MRSLGLLFTLLALNACSIEAENRQAAPGKEGSESSNSSNNNSNNNKNYSFKFELPTKESLQALGLNTNLDIYYYMEIVARDVNCAFEKTEASGAYLDSEILEVSLEAPCNLRVDLSFQRFQGPIDLSSIRYDYDDIGPLIGIYCSSCHNANSTSSDLSSYQEVFAKKDAIANYLYTATMPPNEKTLYYDDTIKILQWIERGAPQKVPLQADSTIGPFVASKAIKIEKDTLLQTQPTISGEYRKVSTSTQGDQ